MIGSVRYDGIERPIDLHDPPTDCMFREYDSRYAPSGPCTDHGNSRREDTVRHGDLPWDLPPSVCGHLNPAGLDVLIRRPFSPTGATFCD